MILAGRTERQGGLPDNPLGEGRGTRLGPGGTGGPGAGGEAAVAKACARCTRDTPYRPALAVRSPGSRCEIG